MDKEVNRLYFYHQDQKCIPLYLTCPRSPIFGGSGGEICKHMSANLWNCNDCDSQNHIDYNGNVYCECGDVEGTHEHLFDCAFLCTSFKTGAKFQKYTHILMQVGNLRTSLITKLSLDLECEDDDELDDFVLGMTKVLRNRARDFKRDQQ